jgi:hypothetical protein
MEWDLLPALRHTRQYDYVLARAVPALVARANAGLDLGWTHEVIGELGPVFNDNPAQEQVAYTLAKAYAANHDRDAAMRVLSNHEREVKKLAADVSDAIHGFREHLLRPSSNHDGAPAWPQPSSLQGRVQPHIDKPGIKPHPFHASVKPGSLQLNSTLPAELSPSNEASHHEHNGPVEDDFAGDWFQLAYDPATQMSGDPWSIEHVSAETIDCNALTVLTGKWKRIWSSDLHKEWNFQAFQKRGGLEGNYEATSDTGAGSGSFGLTRRSCCVLQGEFVDKRKFTYGPTTSTTYEPALLLWVRGSLGQRFVGKWLKEVWSR